MSLIDSIAERFGIQTEQSRNRAEAFKRIEEIGGVELLRNHAIRLRTQGDPTAVVLEHGGYGAYIIVALHWELRQKPYVTSSGWDSRGAGLEATSETPPRVSFTDGDNWNYFEFHAESERWWIERSGLTSRELAVLRTKDAPLQDQIQVAMKLTQPQTDFRYGEGAKSLHKRIDSKNYRLIF